MSNRHVYMVILIFVHLLAACSNSGMQNPSVSTANSDEGPTKDEIRAIIISSEKKIYTKDTGSDSVTDVNVTFTSIRIGSPLMKQLVSTEQAVLSYPWEVFFVTTVHWRSGQIETKEYEGIYYFYRDPFNDWNFKTTLNSK